MKKLSEEIKRMLNALAYASAGENLNLRQKRRVMAGGEAAAPAVEPVSIPKKSGPQVGLYLGSELPPDVMQYVMQTCGRLKHGLTVLTFQSETEAQALLAPYQAALDDAHTRVQLTLLTGEPPAALVHALRKRPDIAFLICNESGYLGRALLKGTVRQDAIPVPVVMVAASDAAAAKPAAVESTATTVRAA
ncbi:MAG: hypothetical protein ACLGG6_01450 [Gammaproteobacteria bacterium]